MEQHLATVMELDSTEPDISLLSWGYSYEKIRIVSAGGSSSSLSAGSSDYSSSKSSRSSGEGSHHHHHHHHRYAASSFQRVGFEVPGPLDHASQMVRDGFVVNLIREFGQAPGPVLERWFSELDVGFVLQPASVTEAELRLGDLMRRWMRGFTLMAEALSATRRHLQDKRSTAGDRMSVLEYFLAIIRIKEQPKEEDLCLQLARFAEATVSNMLAFANALTSDKAWPRPMDKLSGLMGLHRCISDVSGILVPSLKQDARRPTDSEEKKQEARRLANAKEKQSLVSKIDDAFSSRMGSLAKVIWRMVKDAEAVTPLLSGRDSLECFPENAEIHKGTRLIVKYARLFWEEEGRSVLYQIKTDTVHLIQQMFIYLQDQLEKKSESFSDPSLRYIFLLNNSYFIQEQFLATTDYRLPRYKSLKYEEYQENYMRVSWEPVLYCLHDKMPWWFPTYTSQLSRFKSEIQKICRHQKLWKVLNPKLRQRLRETIIDKVITGYTTYLEGYPEQEKCSHDRQDMEDMVNELFEG